MTDWNNDGKEDWKDAYIYHELLNDTESSNYSGSCSGSGFFKVVVGICVGIIILALLLGVEIPGAVITLFLQIIVVAGLIALCMRK